MLDYHMKMKMWSLQVIATENQQQVSILFTFHIIDVKDHSYLVT